MQFYINHGIHQLLPVQLRKCSIPPTKRNDNPQVTTVLNGAIGTSPIQTGVCRRWHKPPAFHKQRCLLGSILAPQQHQCHWEATPRGYGTPNPGNGLSIKIISTAGDILVMAKHSNIHYIRCLWGWFLRVPSQGYHHFPYDNNYAALTYVHHPRGNVFKFARFDRVQSLSHKRDDESTLKSWESKGPSPPNAQALLRGH